MYEMIDLKYDYDGLEPYIDAETINIHYNAHYKSYLDKLNYLLKKNNYNFSDSKEKLVDNISMFDMNDRGEILYNLGGVLNHELYFNSMGEINNQPTGEILRLINRDYGNYSNFQKEFIKTANNLKGSGYTFLTMDKNNKLFIMNTSNQDNPLYYGFKPILALDLWEHAYYLKYRNKRSDYINAFLNIIAFANINKEIKKYL